MRIVGYTYDAALHCEDCAEKAFGAKLYDEERPPLDSEDNVIHPVFNTDEGGDTPEHCDDCGEFIDTEWHSATVDYVVSALGDYIVDYVANRIPQISGNPEVLDVWAGNLHDCIIEDRDEKILAMYDSLRGDDEQTG